MDAVIKRLHAMEYPGVAVGVIVYSEGKILLGKRKGPLGTGSYSLPGGKVDFGESPAAAAAREVLEETGLRVTAVTFTGKVSNDYFPEQGKQFINLFYTAVAVNPQDLHVPESEKGKFDAWLWFDPFRLPDGVWMHTGKVINALAAHALCGLEIPGVDCVE